MEQPPNPNQSVSSNKTKIILVIIFLAILLLTFGILVGLVLRRSGFQLPAPATQTQPIPTSFIPTADCGSPTLLLGTATFEIQNLAPALDGSLSVPADTSGIAYWVEETDTNHVFVLSPSPQNLAVMQTVSLGSTAKATWTDCSSTTYTLSAPQQGSLDALTSLEQVREGITIFFETDSSGAGFVVNGELAEEEIVVVNTPDPSEIQAEIGILETTPSEDGQAITIRVSILNYGTTAFTLSESDVSLAQPDGTPVTLVSSRPRLPERISPGETDTFDFTFQRPASATATLKILTVEYDIEGY